MTNNPQTKMGKFKYPNQRKVYLDCSRQLNIDNFNILTWPANRMDLLLWKNISDLGEKAEVISNNTTLSQFGRCYNEQTLFHYFVSNLDVIRDIHDRYYQARDNNAITP